MDLLKKLLGDGVPEWAQPLSPKLYKEFQSQVISSFNTQNVTPVIDWNLGSAKVASLEIYFHNLIIRWRAASAESRPELVSELLHCTSEALTTSEERLIDRLNDLLIRIYDLEIPHVRNFVNQPIGNFLYASLVIDSPNSTSSVTQSQLRDSEMSVDELFNIAKKNLRARIKPDTQRMIAQIGELTIVTAQFFGASFITILEPATEPGETYWVAVPNKHTMLILKPISHDDDSLLKFLEVANRFSTQLPNDYILPFVLEYKNGVFRDLCRHVESGIEPL